MLPIAWFCLGLVVCLYVVLLFSEVRARAKSHVKRCPSLPYLSQGYFDSLTVIEPDLVIVELTGAAVSAAIGQIPDAHPVPVSKLEEFLTGKSRRSVFVFYSVGDVVMDWPRVDHVVNRLKIPTAYVLKGGLEGWRRHHAPESSALVSEA
jgi:hypothetical protein